MILYMLYDTIVYLFMLFEIHYLSLSTVYTSLAAHTLIGNLIYWCIMSGNRISVTLIVRYLMVNRCVDVSYIP